MPSLWDFTDLVAIIIKRHSAIFIIIRNIKMIGF